MIRQYSLAREGEQQIAKNFRVREFACKDGSDAILIDDKLLAILQQLRDYFRCPVYVGSGFRTASYNARIGGHPRSLHLTGRAADIDVGSGVKLVDPLLVCMMAQAMGCSGLGCYKYQDGRSWSHIGSGQTGQFWTQAAPGQQRYIKTFLPVLRKGTSHSDACRIAQVLLGDRYTGKIDGKFGKLTLAAVKSFQAEKQLETDGVIGPKTWPKFFE